MTFPPYAKFCNRLQILINRHGIDAPGESTDSFLREVFMLTADAEVWHFDEQIDMCKFFDGPMIQYFLTDLLDPEVNEKLGEALTEYVRKDLIKELERIWISSPGYDNDDGEVGPAKYEMSNVA